MKNVFVVALTMLLLALSCAKENSCKAPEPPKSHLYVNDFYAVYREIDRELCNVCYIVSDGRLSCIHLPLDVCTPTKYTTTP